MQNKDPNDDPSFADRGDQLVPSGVDMSSGMHQPPSLAGTSLEEVSGQPVVSPAQPPGRSFWHTLLWPYGALVALVLVTGLGALWVATHQDRSGSKAASTASTNRFDPVKLPLEELIAGKNLATAGPSKVTINGTLQIGGSLLLNPSLQPTGAKPGQLYYDQTLNQLAYYNGSNFVFLTGPEAGGVQSLGGATGQVTLGPGLSLTDNQLSSNGVLSVQGQAGAVTFTAGAGLVINGTNFSNSGVISIASSTPSLSVANDGSGNVTLTMTSGSGTVTSGGGTSGAIPIFTASQNIENSIISQAGLAVTVAGDLSVTGNLGLTNALTVANGGTGTGSLAANGVLLGNGTSAVSSVAAGGSGLCLLSTAGAPTWGVCPGGGGVTSLDGLTGGLTIANSSGAGSTITIDNASTSAKGIASFNSTNFSVASGAVNTIQNINSGATPTFAGVNTNTITPSGAMTIGATGQSLLLQGNASTALTATNGGSSTTVSFQSPTANVTYRFLTTSAGTYDVCTTAANCSGVGGGVTTPGGTANRLAKFGSSQAITNSSITDDGTNVLTSIDMVIQGGDLTVGVPSTQVGTINLAHSGSAFLGSILQGALSADRTYTLPDASGTFCLTSGNCAGGVTSLNGLVGALNIANATAAGSTITLDDASTSAKGIASFNSTNFSVSSGAVNTIQNINSGASPTFAAVNTNTITPSAAMTLGSTGQTALLRGSITTITSNGAGNDIILTSADTIELQGATNITGNIDISGAIAAGTANAFQVAANGNITTAGNVVAQGGSVTIGTTSQAGSLVIHDGAGNTGTLLVGALGQGTTYTLPDPGAASATICLTSGNCAGSGGGVTTAGGTTNRLAKFSGSQSIADSTISDNGTTVTTTVDMTIQGGDLTIGTSSQLASIILHDGNGQTTTLQAGDSSGGLTFILPTNAGSASQCLKQSGTGNQLIWDACDGGGGGSTATLQTAYSNSSSPEITLDATRGALTVRDSSGGIGANLLEVQNNAGSTTYFGVTASGVSVTGTASATGNVNSSGGTLQTNSTTRIDNSGNLSNIGNLTATGAITIASSGAGNDIVINGADIFDVQDATTFASTVGVNGVATFNNNLAANGDVAIGDAATDLLTITAVLQGGSPLVFEGASADANELTLSVAALTGDQTLTLPDETGTVCVRNSTNCGFALSSGSNNYIQNQSAGDQSADFRITGTGQVGTALLSPSLDTASATTLTIAGTNANIINVANNATAHIVQIATSSSAAQTVTVGSLNAGSTTAIQGGTGGSAVSIQGGTGGTVSIGTTNSNTITVGNATTTATLTLGQSTASNTINIGNATTATGNTQTINIGTSATGTGKATITIGNTNDGSALNLQAGTGNINLITNASTASVIAKSSTNSATAFQVQNATSASLLTVDTSGSNVSLLGNNSPTLATWTTTTAMSVGSNTARVRGGSIAANGYLYQIGGVDGTGTALTTVQYAKLNADGTVGTWASTTALPAARKQFQPVVVNGYLYVIGGRNDSNVIQSTAYYAKLNTDGTVGSWNTTTALSTGAAARFTQGTVAYNGYIYVLGGFDSGITSQSTVYYIKANPDGTLGSTWNTTTAMPVGLSSINGSLVVNGYVYVVGGFTTGYEDDIYYAKLNADGTLGSWGTASGVLNPSGGGDENLLNFVANGYLYVVGGDLNDRVVAFPLGSDGSLGAATTLTDFPLNPVGEAGGASANGYFYILGGSTSSDGGGTARDTVYYTSGSRVKVGGNLDLVSYSGENLAEGRSGGQLTAGDTTVVGRLQVQDAATFTQNASVGGSLRVGNNLYVGDSTASSSSLNVIGTLTVTGLQPTSVSGNGTTANDNTLTAGKGGNTTGTTGQTGGTGGGWIIAGGAGGDAPSGSTNGSGGSIVLQGGAAGSGAGGGNFRGNVIMQGSGGYVGIGTLSPTAFLHISASDGLTTDLFKITDSTSVAADVFRVADEGAVTLKNRTDSSAGFLIQNTSSQNMLTVSTSGSILQIGSTTTDNTAIRLVLDSFNDVNDPPGFNGAMYYNTAWHQYRCYRAVNSTAADGAWEPCGINPIDRGFMVEDDFLGGYDVAGELGQLGWVEHPSSTVSNFNYNTGGLAPTADHPGMLEISTGGSSGNGSTLTLDGDASGAVLIAPNNVVKSTVGLDTTLANSILRVGLHSELTTSTRPVSGVWWEAAPSVNAKWQYCYGNGTTATCAAASSNANIAATQWYRLEIRVTATGTNTSSAEFFVDGTKYTVSGVTIDTTNRVNPAIACFTSTAASRDCDIDYFQFRGVSSAAR